MLENLWEKLTSRNQLDFGTLYTQVTDTTDEDAKEKIHSAVVRHTSHFNILPNFAFLAAENSILAGTKASELVTNSQRPERLIVGVNYAPPDRAEGTKDNIRNDFYCADLGNKTFVCGTSNGLEFSYIKPLIKDFFRLTTTNALHSQFRSLEVLPEHAIRFSIPKERQKLIASGALEFVKNIDAVVPSVPDVTHVFQVDNFKNVKLFLSNESRRLLEKLAQTRADLQFSFGTCGIELNGNARAAVKSNGYKAIAAKTLFAAPLGTNVVAWKSSSVLCGGREVPCIATIRDLPGQTEPSYLRDIPSVGFPVFLTTQNSSLACATPRF